MNRARLIRIAVGAAVLAMLAYLARGYVGELRRLPSVSPLLVVGIFALYLAMRALNGLMMKLALRALGYVITLGEAVMLAILTTYANLLLPRAGLGVPAVYLKIRRGISYADFTSQAMIVTTLQCGCIGICGLICQAALKWGMGNRIDPLVTGLFVVALLIGIGTPLVKPTVFPDSEGRLANFLHRIAAAWGRIGSSRGTVLAILLWNVPMLMLRAWRLQLSFYAIGAPVSFLGAFVASLLADLMFFVSVTPGGLGFREAAITYSSAMLGTDPGVALTASLLDRAVWTAGVVLVAQVGMWRMIRPALRAARDGAEQPPAEVKVASSLEAQ
jgi:uncharacterized membrane protein YbhN (UPF0104 family)